MSRMEQIRPISMVAMTAQSLVFLVAGGLNLSAVAADKVPVKEAKPSWTSPLQAPKASPAPKTNDRQIGLLKPSSSFAAAPLQKAEAVKKQVLQKPVPIDVKEKTKLTAPKSLIPSSKFSQGAGLLGRPQSGLLAEPLPIPQVGRGQFKKASKPVVHRDSSVQPASGEVLESEEAFKFPAPQNLPLESQNSLPFPNDSTPRMTPPEKSLFSNSPTEPKPAPALGVPADAPLQPSSAPQLSQPDSFAPSAIPRQPISSPSSPAFQTPNNAFEPAQQQATYNPPSAEPKLLTPSPQQAVQEEVHEVQPGENYWTISRQHFGTARYFAALAEYNKHRIPRPDRMRPGMFVLVPDSKILDQRYPKMAGIVNSKPSPESLLPSGFFIGPNGQPLFRIGKGDTLTDIAEKHLGRTARWTQVVGMNRDLLRDGNTLKIGMVLRLPHDASQVALAPATSVLR